MRISVITVVSVVTIGASLAGQSLQDHAFDSNGIRIRYVEAGSGTPIVLVHGYSRSVETNWLDTGVFADLARDHRVIAYDLPGHGKSGKPTEPAAYHDIASDPIRLMDHLGIARAHLIGYSLGGGVVARMAATHPERMITAILGGHSGYRDWSSEDEQFYQSTARELESDVPFRSQVSVVPAGTPQPTETEIRSMSAALVAENDVKALAALRRGGFRGLYNTRAQAAAIRVPFLMIYGTLDSVESGREMQTIMPTAKLVVIDGATHGGPKSAARRPEFLTAVRQFVDPHK
jgi:pimeloyl-ACP methyl ester carboxylesterase